LWISFVAKKRGSLPDHATYDSVRGVVSRRMSALREDEAVADVSVVR
jgi:hypothetical protein